MNNFMFNQLRPFFSEAEQWDFQDPTFGINYSKEVKDELYEHKIKTLLRIKRLKKMEAKLSAKELEIHNLRKGYGV